MKKNLFLIVLCLLLEASMTYCPVKRTYLDSMWFFLSKNIKRPSVGFLRTMTEGQKEDWLHLYNNNPTVLMDSERNQIYISILQDLESKLLLVSLGNSHMITTEDKRAELLTNIRRRLALARSGGISFSF